MGKGLGMRSLLIRIFASFWSIIVITIITAAAIGFSYAERNRVAIENFAVSDAVLEASEALRDGGREGLSDWLDSMPGITKSLVYITDEEGADILGRRLPSVVRLAMRRFGHPARLPPRMRRDSPNLRPARPFTQLIGPDDSIYTVFVLPPKRIDVRWFADRGRAGLAILALMISAAVSYLLARTISRPIRELRESANAIAGGKLDTRVAERVGNRRDEIGLLAQDFDRMADGLERAWLQQAELTQNVSHELRSPLARLRVALELVRRKTGELPELERIDAETERLDELIGQILELSRLNADTVDAPQPVDLGELVRSVVDDVRYEYAEIGSEASIVFECVDDVVVRGHAPALTSCVENVLRNAIQHSPDGGEVRVRLSADETTVQLVVEDLGGGVADSELDRIFEPFYRSRKHAARAQQSGGLGLAIAARAIALNGGTIRASNAAAGLRIDIQLPLAP